MQNLANSIFNLFQRNTKAVKHLFVSTALVTVGIVIFHVFTSMSDGISEEFEKTIVPIDNSKNILPPEAFKNCPDSLISAYEEKVIGMYYLKISSYSVLYYSIAKAYYKYYIAFVNLAEISVFIAVIMLLFILKTGYANANEYVLNVFFTTTAISTLMFTFPQILKNEENINTSVSFFEHYNDLRNEILDYSVNCTCISDTALSNLKRGRQKIPVLKICKADKFIHYLQLDISCNFSMPINIDHSKINSIKDESNSFTNLVSGN